MKLTELNPMLLRRSEKTGDRQSFWTNETDVGRREVIPEGKEPPFQRECVVSAEP